MSSAKILVVEDELVTRSTLKSVFEAEGYQVFEANDGEEMHQVLDNNDIHLIIMDINLPGKNIRARNLLTRTMQDKLYFEQVRQKVESYKFSGWTLEIDSRSLISPNGQVFKLPRSEFRAILHFIENPGKIQTRADLLMKMTGRELKTHDRTVDVTIRRIRKHFESVPESAEIISTIHGEGYRFCGELEN